MTGVEIVQDIVEILSAGITSLGTAIGSGISNFAQALAFQTVGTGSDAHQELSVYFVLVIVFAGVSLAKFLVLMSAMAYAKFLNFWEISLRQSEAKPHYLRKVQRLAQCA